VLWGRILFFFLLNFLSSLFHFILRCGFFTFRLAADTQLAARSAEYLVG